MKRLILLLNIIFTSFGTIIAKDYEPTTEKFDTIEMSIEACMKVIRTDSCFSVIIPDTTNLKYLDLIVVNNILKVSYKNQNYKDLINGPIRMIIWAPDTVEIKPHKDYTIKYKPKKD